MHGPLNVKISICISNIHISVSILFTPTLSDLFTWKFFDKRYIYFLFSWYIVLVLRISYSFDCMS